MVGGDGLRWSCVRASFFLVALVCGPSSLDQWFFWVLRAGGRNRLALVEDSFLGVRAACAFLRACACALVMAVVGYGRCCCSWNRLVLLRFESAAFDSGAGSFCVG